MKILVRITLILWSMLVCLSTAYSSIPNNDHPKTFLGPNIKGSYTSPITDITAYSVAGEAGLKNFRLGGTIGWRLQDNQRLKASAEYLWQKITYPFFDGNTDQWVQQGAIGADYQYELLGYNYKPLFDLNVYVSHAPSKTLGIDTGVYIDSSGLSQSFVDMRRIAGSNADGISPGITIEPWQGGKVGVDLNYDNVRYDKKFAPNEDAKGLGGTIHLDQAITQDVAIGALVAIRQPFNNYTANIVWSNVPYFGSWSFGVDGAYTAGKNTLPSTYDISLSANYSVDPLPATTAQRQAEVDDLVAWSAKPAVYMPQVLAIPDEGLSTVCTEGKPTFIGTIANAIGESGFGTTPPVSTKGNFTGNNLTFSINSISPALASGDTITINPTTGVVTSGIFTENTYNVVVKVSNACGSATSNLFSLSSPG